jgi:hypothetical protein
MTVSIAVTLHCDSRGVPGCHWSYDLGWQTVRSGGKVGHLCPVCNGARLAGADVRPRPTAQAAPVPTTIGEAAARDRRRLAHQDRG